MTLEMYMIVYTVLVRGWFIEDNAALPKYASSDASRRWN